LRGGTEDRLNFVRREINRVIMGKDIKTAWRRNLEVFVRIMLTKCKRDSKMREHTELNQRTNTRTQQLHVVGITNTMESILLLYQVVETWLLVSIFIHNLFTFIYIWNIYKGSLPYLWVLPSRINQLWMESTWRKQLYVHWACTDLTAHH
jgi:hypothetical protein